MMKLPTLFRQRRTKPKLPQDVDVHVPVVHATVTFHCIGTPDKVKFFPGSAYFDRYDRALYTELGTAAVERFLSWWKHNGFKVFGEDNGTMTVVRFEHFRSASIESVVGSVTVRVPAGNHNQLCPCPLCRSADQRTRNDECGQV